MSEAVTNAIELNSSHIGAWFPFITILIYGVILLKINIKLTKLEMYLTSLFALYLSIITDYVLGMTFQFYEYFDQGGDIWTPITVIPLYVLTNLVFLNLYPFTSSQWKKWIYILVWSLYATVWEWFSVEYTSFFSHDNWKLWYSAVIYPFLYLLILGNLKFIRSNQVGTKK
ncbi:hypothetical protein [Bacillus pinisoli]|uniref:hypothetical protein n=1 Tax=Bacillus pinisoli TaxID=2901866 RepID=UPI001FF3FEEA|nr:hypothetical protein [Bacillus pinisoli]